MWLAKRQAFVWVTLLYRAVDKSKDLSYGTNLCFRIDSVLCLTLALNYHLLRKQNDIACVIYMGGVRIQKCGAKATKPIMVGNGIACKRVNPLKPKGTNVYITTLDETLDQKRIFKKD